MRPAPLLLAVCLVAAAPAAAEPAAYDPRAAFTQSDTDHSGAVDRRELNDRAVEVFFHADADKDGFLGLAEYRALPHGGELTVADGNRDGRLSVSEYVRVRDLEFESADRDKDGELTVDEVVAAWEVDR